MIYLKNEMAKSVCDGFKQESTAEVLLESLVIGVQDPAWRCQVKLMIRYDSKRAKEQALGEFLDR